jgi:hypothetical protein
MRVGAVLKLAGGASSRPTLACVEGGGPNLRLVPTDSEEAVNVRALLAWADEVEKLHARYFRGAPALHPGSRLDRDDAVLRPYHLSHEVSQRLSVALDSLHGLRAMTLDEASGGVELRTYAPFPLLRAALENACVVAWLLESDEELVRATRRVHLWVRSNQERFTVEKVIYKDVTNQRAKEPPTLIRRQDEDFLDRMRVLGVTDLDKLVKDPKRSTASVGAMVSGGSAALRKQRGSYQPQMYSVGWRALSGATHGDLWALMAVTMHEVLGEPDSATDRIDARVSFPISSFVVWTHMVTSAVKGSLRLYDRDRLVLTDHSQAKPSDG